METSYNFGLVLLSVVVAIAGAYVAVEIAQRVREATGRRRTLWLLGGALAMGLGIWSMHFVAMLALRLAEPVWYDAFVTFLSVVAAVGGCAVAFAIFDRSRVTARLVGIASVVMGLAIAGMHYTGMAAMRMSGAVHYDRLLVAASVAVAIAVSFAALIVTRTLITSRDPAFRGVLRTAGAALLMGLAVVSMHYTGMAAATFTAAAEGSQPDGGLLLGNRNLGLVVAVVSLVLLALALAGTQFESWSLEASSRIESLLQLSPQIVWSANAAGMITDCNRYWYDYTGLAREQSLGDAWGSALYPKDRERVITAWRGAVEAGTDLEVEFRLRRMDGAYHWFLSKGRPVRGDGGEVIRWIGIAIDIEDRKIAEREILKREEALEAQTAELRATTRELMQKSKEAEAANRAKSDFLASMSHELRTPLNAIGGYADLLEMGLRGPLTAAQSDDIARIKRSQQHLLGLINDVLNFAKVDAGRLEYRIGDVPLGTTMSDTEAMIRPQLMAKGLQYRFDGCSSAGFVRADRDKLQQIVLNLLGNAVKFTDRGGEITVSCEVDGDTMLLRVSDTGVGIPADKIDTIFDPFVQVDQRPNQMNQGVGLGLSISRALACAMSGDLTVESAPGCGSTFTLSLPRSLAGVPAAS
ncbi:MAG: ATP-binding protein [Gemmatimonadota bacterium]|nr:ATP-binding protein [Gemmatimonadota bacterium]